MTDDIVERLRAKANQSARYNNSSSVPDKHVCWEAADLIVTLRAQIAEAERGMRERAALEIAVKPQDIRLAAGEMSAQEMRTVRSILPWLQSLIRALPLAQEPRDAG